MTDNTILLTCASWEDRFRLGLKRDLDSHTHKAVLMYYLDEFSSWSSDNRIAAQVICAAQGAECIERKMTAGNPAGNWNQIQKDVAEIANTHPGAHVDISTMPRELIWTLFWSLHAAKIPIVYSYHCPEAYHEEWQSRDPKRPRLVFKLSGIAQLDRRTSLIALTGYDSQRTAQLIRFYEPEMSFVGLQKGDVNKGNSKHMDEQRHLFSQDPSITQFDLDAFSEDFGEGEIYKHLHKIIGTHNVIVGCLGPKLSAVAVYRLHRKHPEIGITYAPSGEFNREYSTGIGQCFTGTV